jgi:CheY-like chemotaxis protein
VDGAQAVEEAAREQPDVVLMDIRMPRLDGLEATRRIKAGANAAGIGIIIVSAHPMPEDRLLGEAAGCDAFLTKPVNHATLEATIAAVVEQRATEPAVTGEL